jgi:hypothetical protein
VRTEHRLKQDLQSRFRYLAAFLQRLELLLIGQHLTWLTNNLFEGQHQTGLPPITIYQIQHLNSRAGSLVDLALAV